jgi:flagellar basal body-associated protein FliL
MLIFQDRPTMSAHAPAGSETPASEPGAKPSLIRKLMLPVFLLLVVGAETAAAYLFIPRAGQVAAEAAPSEGKAEEKKQAEHGEKEEKAKSADKDEIEIDLGKFTISSFQPSSNSTLLIDFHLYGTLSPGKRDGFEKALEENMHRFRDQVIVIVRSSELTDLTDAGLGLIKRKILEKTNAMLGGPTLRTIIFSDFSFLEQ